MDQIKSPNDFERILDKGKWGIYVTNNSGGSGILTFFQQFSGADGAWVTGAPNQRPIAAGATVIVEILYDSDNVANNPTVLVNGTTMTMTENTTPTGTRDDDSASNLVIGNNAANNAELDGKISEIIAYSTQPSEARS